MGWGWVVTLVGGGVCLLVYLVYRFPNTMGAIGDIGSSIADGIGDSSDSGGC